MTIQAKPKRILLIFRSEDYRKVVQLALNMASDWDVMSTNSVEEGLVMLEEGIFDTILLNGDFEEEELLRILTYSHTNLIPVIVLADGRVADLQPPISLDVVGVLPKFSNPLNLAKQISSTLQ